MTVGDVPLRDRRRFSWRTSEQELERKLDLTRSIRTGHLSDLAKVRVAESGIVIVGVGIAEYGVIRHIERLGTELQIVIFCEFENLEQRQIDHTLVRPVADIARRIADFEICRDGEGRRIQPLAAAA